MRLSVKHTFEIVNVYEDIIPNIGPNGRPGKAGQINIFLQINRLPFKIINILPVQAIAQNGNPGKALG